MTEPFLEFEIQIDGAGISDLRSPDGSVTIIPFGGRVDSPLFRGEIGAAGCVKDAGSDPERGEEVDPRLENLHGVGRTEIGGEEQMPLREREAE